MQTETQRLALHRIMEGFCGTNVVSAPHPRTRNSSIVNSAKRGNHEAKESLKCTQCFNPAVQLSTTVSDLLLSTGSPRMNLLPFSVTQYTILRTSTGKGT